MADAQCSAPLETGGLLMGYWDTAADTAVVTAIVGPGPKAKQSRTSLIPDHTYQEQEIARIYAESGRVTTYLGDWHSHPNGAPRPSRIDRRTLRRIVRSESARLKCSLMMIVSGGPLWVLTGWAAFKTSRIIPVVRVTSARLHYL
jgi:integrative and conjugative element protein (TIGR02256 family)